MHEETWINVQSIYKDTQRDNLRLTLRTSHTNEQISWVIDKDNVNESNEEVMDLSPLTFVIPNAPGHVDYLFSLGADPNWYDDRGETPLNVAIATKDASIVSLLLNHGASVREPDRRGYFPIDIVKIHRHGQIARMLIDRGADPLVGQQMDSLPGPLLQYQGWRNCRRDACIALIGIGKCRHKGLIRRDIMGLVAKHVWSRRTEESKEYRREHGIARQTFEYLANPINGNAKGMSLAKDVVIFMGTMVSVVLCVLTVFETLFGQL